MVLPDSFGLRSSRESMPTVCLLTPYCRHRTSQISCMFIDVTSFKTKLFMLHHCLLVRGHFSAKGNEVDLTGRPRAHDSYQFIAPIVFIRDGNEQVFTLTRWGTLRTIVVQTSSRKNVPSRKASPPFKRRKISRDIYQAPRSEGRRKDF